MRRVAGFSLLEALVALAIAATSLAAIMAFQDQLVDSQKRSDAALATADLRKNALVLLRQVNPDETPDGELALPPDHLIRWTSTQLTEPRVSAGFPNGDGQYTVALYRLAVEILGPGDQLLDAFEVERMGHTFGTVRGL